MWGISYDEQWEPAENASQAAYHLLVTPVDSETALLGGASIAVYASDGELLVTLPVAWQEQAGDSGEVADHG